MFFELDCKQRCTVGLRNTTDAGPCNVVYSERLTIPMFELKHKHTVNFSAGLFAGENCRFFAS